ncbi:MAG: F0F1 ATP synthase subunit epsilon [Ignavibacteriaceae bacterium]
MAELNLEIVTPDKSIFNEVIESVTIPGTLGSFQILINHAPLISTFDLGVVTVKSGDEPTYFSTSGGTVEVNNNKVLVLADSIEPIEQIDIDRAEKAKERAEERLKRKHEKDVDEVRAAVALKRAINRINVKEKYI